MASSDEDEVCVGPLSLNDLKKALNIMDPFRKGSYPEYNMNNKKGNSANHDLINDGIHKSHDNLQCSPNIIYLTDSDSVEKSDSIYKSEYQKNENDGSINTNFKDYSLIVLDHTEDDLLAMDPLADATTPTPNLRDLNCGLDNTNVIVLDDSSESSELPFSPYISKLIKKSDTTTDWVGLMNNVSNNDFQILDQTEPEELHQLVLEDTIVPQIQSINKLNLTVLEQPDWQNESINKFENIERLVGASPLPLSDMIKSREMQTNTNASDSYVTTAYESAQQSSFSTSTDSQSHTKDIFFTAQNTSADSELESEADKLNSDQATLTISTNSNRIIHNDDINTSKEFDNTFDEMQYVMALTKSNVPVQHKTPEQKVPTVQGYPKFSPITPTSDSKTQKSPLSARRIKPKTYYPKPNPLKTLHPNNEFRRPDTPCLFAKKAHTIPQHNNYDHIVSPIGMYIKNSPKVPLMGTNMPGRNILNKVSHQEMASRNKNDILKENLDVDCQNKSPLPVKAYKCSAFTTTTTVKTPNLLGSLKKNDKIMKLISTTPKQEVIRHEGRIKQSKLPRLKCVKLDDSFANLSVSSAEVSVYVKKEVEHTETILKKKK